MHILITRNSSSAEAVDASMMLVTYLSSQGMQVSMTDAQDTEGFDPQDFDLVVSLGGDGTMLHTAHFAGVSGLPILGLNFGHLGFLTNRVDDGAVAAVAAALSGDVVREERTNLCIDVLCEGDDEDLFDAAFNEESLMPAGRRFFGLNEGAITRGASGKVVDFELGVSGAHIADMRADGLIIASATGSTAYALSAGGPLVAPGFGGLIVVPVAPHTLLARAIVTNTHDVVEVRMGENRASREAVLFVDGDPITFDEPMRRVRVVRGVAPTVMLQYKHKGFYAHASEVFFG
ncbi:MAG: NAD(+)/NADH kinase [Eggerthellaceae bacterium]|nr:NAD(+)/NADH kinase [Eggerthellaceae bacterium]